MYLSKNQMTNSIIILKIKRFYINCKNHFNDKKPFKVILFIFLSSLNSHSQVQNSIKNLQGGAFQFGCAVKMSFEIQKFTNFRLSISGGLGKKIKDIEFLYPTLNSEIQIYNGGLGSNLLYGKHRKLKIDFVTSFMITCGVREVNYLGYITKNNPLNYFSDLSATALQNPYYNSISLGSNYILSTDRKKENQLVGVANINIERTVQITYYNDGTPFSNFTGDGYDRYYTGGGTISYYGNYRDKINHIEISYHKFTGYQRNAFETANHMQIDFIPYNDYEAFYYNQSRWKLKAGNYENGFGVFLTAYDKPNWDAQDVIHFKINNAYHPDLFNTPRYGFGLDYGYLNWTTR